MAAKIPCRLKSVLVGQIIANKDWDAIAEWLFGHQCANRVALVRSPDAHLEYHGSSPEFELMSVCKVFDPSFNMVFDVGHSAVMEGGPGGLLFHHDAQFPADLSAFLVDSC